MIKKYACLECGFVHDGTKIEKIRHDINSGGRAHIQIKAFHGFITYRICPECEHKQKLFSEEDDK